MSGIPSFFSNSPQRMSVLEEIAHRRIPCSPSTRWNFKSRTVQTVFDLKDSLIECCSKLEESRSKTTGNAASGIKRMLNDSNFLFWLEFFNRVMPHVDILYSHLQLSTTDAIKITSCLSIFSAAIQNIRDSLDETAVSDKESRSSKPSWRCMFWR